jgi:hypothetical protein
MENQLTQDQLAKVVAEVEQLSQSRESEVDREQVKEILQELNLSSDLLDEALVQVHRREALAVQQRRNQWIIGGVVLALIGAITTATLSIQNRQSVIANLSASQSRITLATDNGGNLATIERQTSPEVFYRITLQEAPIGEKLSLKCDWIDPTGQIAHQNRWETRQIDNTVWSTHCRYQFGSAAPSGTWKVQMSLGDHVLSTTTFVVK